jgi:hypothetical protein
MKKRETKKVRNLRRRVRNHALDALVATLELVKRDPKTPPAKLYHLLTLVRDANAICREWTAEDMGFKQVAPGAFTVGH